MGSRKQSPGRCVEDNFAGAPSTLGEVGKAAQPVSRCQSRQCEKGFEEGNEVEGCHSVESQCAKSCAAATFSSVTSGIARGSSSQGLTVEGCDQCVGRCGHGREGSVWNELSCVRRLKSWCLPCQHRSLQRRGFIEREKIWLVVAEEAVKVAVRNRDECLDALVQAEKRFEELQAQEKSPFAPVRDPEVELSRLRAQVAELQESTRVADRRTRQRVSPVETMPALVPAELSVWMENRQADVQDALIKGDHSRVIELSSLLTKAAERMVERVIRASQTTNSGLVQHQERVGSSFTYRKMFSQVQYEG